MPDFHTDAGVIVESHIQQLLKLEEKDADRVLKTYKKVRQELRDRLDTLPGEKFTAQRLRGVLLQIESAIEAMARGLARDMDDEAQEVAEKSIKDLEKEIKQFSKKFTGAVIPIDVDAVRLATDTRNFLFSQYKTSLQAYSEDVRSNIARGLSMAAIEEITVDETIRRIGRFFLAEEWRLRRIVRTEIHNIYNHGKIFGMKEIRDSGQIPNLKKTLIHPMDSRTGDDSKAVDKKDLVVDIEKPFRYIWKGKERVFQAPPDRANDRSILIPYRKEWDA